MSDEPLASTPWLQRGPSQRKEDSDGIVELKQDTLLTGRPPTELCLGERDHC